MWTKAFRRICCPEISMISGRSRDFDSLVFAEGTSPFADETYVNEGVVRRSRNLNKAKPIADAGFGFDVLGFIGIWLDLLPEVRDIDAQVVGSIFRAGSPNFPEDLAVGQNFPRMLDE